MTTAHKVSLKDSWPDSPHDSNVWSKFKELLTSDLMPAVISGSVKEAWSSRKGEHLTLKWNAFYLGLVRSPHIQSFYRVADSHISVHTHHCQGEGAGEHVVVVDRHYSLAQSVPEWPKAQKHVGALETRNQRMNIEVQLEAKQRTLSPVKYDLGQVII